MALKNLSIEEMQQVSGGIVHPENAAHKALTASPRLQGRLVDVQDVHQGRFAAMPKNAPKAAEIAALAATVDGLHDTLVRGLHGCLTSVALLIDDGAPLIAVRDRLVPEGVAKIIRNTFRGQAGYTALLRRRLNAEDRETLSSVPLPSGKSLMDATDAWLDAGDRLGRLEEEKARLDAANPTLAGRIHEARMKWIRVVNVLLTTAELAELDETSERALFGPLRDAEAKTEQRLARQQPKDVAPEGSPKRVTKWFGADSAKSRRPS